MESDITLFLGRKQVEVTGKVRIERKIETDTIEVGFEPHVPANTMLNAVRTDKTTIFMDDKPFAVTRRYLLKKDIETGYMTLKLYKNQTELL